LQLEAEFSGAVPWRVNDLQREITVGRDRNSSVIVRWDDAGA
jgi:hypothetical protein